MMKSMLAAALALSAALLPGDTAAATTSAGLGDADAASGLGQTVQVFCGPYGCGPVWPGPRDDRWGSARWGHVYRPACPTDYYYACQRGPLGYRRCACWPYRTW